MKALIHLRGIALAAAAVVLVMTASSAAYGAAIRVTTTGAATMGCGSTWPMACDFHFGLDVQAVPGDELWVQAGTYKPHASVETVSFNLRSGIAVYGGFATGGETRSASATS